MMMRILASHPKIIANEAYPLEFKAFVFSLYPEQAFRSQTESERYSFTGDEDCLREPLRRNGRLTRSDVENVYARLAANSGKTPSFFAEKFPSWLPIDPSQADVVDLRTIVLHRDPRDVLLSARAFDQKRGFRGFRERDGDSDEDVVVKYRDLYRAFLMDLERAREPITIRYEDVLLAPVETVGRVFRELGVESDDATVTAALSRADALEDGRHRTTAGSSQSHGRWRTECPSALRELFARHFTDLFPRLGYPLT